MSCLRNRTSLTVLVMVLGVSGCGSDDETRDGRGSAPTSQVPTPPAGTETAVTTPSPSETPTPVLSATVRQTGFKVVRDNQEIDAAGLQAIGWTIDPAAGSGTWTDPALGTVIVSWDVPEANPTRIVDSAFFGEVTGQNLAFEGVSWSSVGFTSDVQETTGAHSLGGVRAEGPRKNAIFEIPDQPPGTPASMSINLGFPQPVLVVYDYVYE